jgi:TonB family protein
MSGKNKNTRKSLSEFLRYSKGEMTGKERNDFEKELQRDSFAEEAAEGFGSLSPKELLSDIKTLQNRLGTRRSVKRKYIFYRIAASVAFLMIISTIFIVIELNKPGDQLAKSDKPVIILEIPEGEPVIQNIADNLETIETGEKYDKKSVRAVDIKKAEEARSEAYITKDKNLAGIVKKDTITPASVRPVEILMAEEKMAAPAAMAKSRSAAVLKVKGTVLSSDDNMPVPGASIRIKGTSTGVVTDASGNFTLTLHDPDKRTLVADFIGMETKEFEAKADSQLEVKLDPSLSALSEVVVVGYGVRKDADLQTGYSAPRPVNGKSAFEKYIEENIQRPDTTTIGQRVVVVISFTVLSDGKIDNLKIVRSPGKQFSEEAIRLIKYGPQWRPAEENGKVIDEEVRIRIVFK